MAKNEDEKGRIINEYLKVKENETQKYTSFITRENENGYYKSSRTGSRDKKIKISYNELIINKLLAFDSIYCHSLLKRYKQYFCLCR